MEPIEGYLPFLFKPGVKGKKMGGAERYVSLKYIFPFAN